VSIFDTYRVVYTIDGVDTPGTPTDLQNAMARFDEFMAGQQPLMRDAQRVRVISEKVWIESQAVKR
jgi:hypothetical protein